MAHHNEKGIKSLANSGALVGFHDGHLRQVPIELVVVEAKSPHKPVGNLETAVVHRNLHNTARVTVEEGAHGERIGSAAGQRLQQIPQREAGIHDILDQQHVFAFNTLVEVLGDSHHARRAAFVGEAGNAQEVDLDRNFNVTRQGGEEKN